MARPLVLQLALDRAAPARARRAVSHAAATHPRVDDLILATSEIVTNAVRHTNADEAVLHLETTARWVRVAVEHPGNAFHPTDPATTHGPSGRGLAIVEAVVDRWGVEGAERTTVWFEIEAR